VSDNTPRKLRKPQVNIGRPLTARHKRAISEGKMRAKILREFNAQSQNEEHATCR
jgi:hypothetical protein